MSGREYRITVDGEISDLLGGAFVGMELRRVDGKSQLVGWIRDQAELQGLLQRICDFGMPLLSVTAVSSDDEEGVMS